MPNGVRLVTLPAGTGYGDAGRAYLDGLLSVGVPVMWIPMEPGNGRWSPDFGYSPGVGRIYDQGLDMRAEDFDVLVLDLPPFKEAGIYHRWLQEVPDALPVVYTTWECDRLPPWWTKSMALFDLVLVPSSFNQRTFLDSGVERPIKVVPHVAREAKPTPGGKFGDIVQDDFVFYTIGSWTSRKAMEKTIRCYLETFSADEPVALVVKTDPADLLAFRAIKDGKVKNPPKYFGMTWWTIAHILSEYPHAAKLHLIGNDVPQGVIDQLHTRGDCFISLAYSEGWGLGPFDAGLFGNPSVITGWGGHLDYFGTDYPLLVNFELEPTTKATPDMHMETSDDRYWARADAGHAGSLMRWVFEHQDEARSLGQSLKLRLAIEYAPKRVCGRLARLLGFEIKSEPS